MSELTVNATPDKSLIRKLGMAGYSTGQAIAEIVDNAIDARIDGEAESIEVTLDYAGGTITVRDDGRGMDIGGLERAWTIAGASSGPDGRIGKFGMGLKSATSALGSMVSIGTRAAGSDQRLVLAYDEEEWLGDKGASWDKIKVSARAAEGRTHGTEIAISGLRAAIYAAQATKLRDEFGMRYGPYIRDGIVSISVNGRQCVARNPDIEDSSVKGIEFTTGNGTTVNGWIALQRRRSIRGDYGIHLYSNGRLIRPYAKFGIPEHPTVARIIGSVSLDNVPVNIFKTGFLTESAGYRQAQDAFRSDRTVREMLRVAAEHMRKEHDVESIVNSCGSAGDQRILRLGDAESQRLIDGIEEIPIKSKFGKTVMRMENADSGVYRIERRGDVTEILVNRQSGTFRAFRNPLLLLIMLRLEVETMPRNGVMPGHVQERNAAWESHLAGVLAPRARKTRTRNLETLHGDLAGLQSHLGEFPHKMQFTGLSTLTEYLHYAYNKMVYTVYTIKGAGGQLERAIRGHGEFDVLRNPTRAQFEAVFELSRKNVIAIREYAKVPNSIVAPLEKSWVDLYFEVKRKKMVQYEAELEMIKDLVHENQVSRGRIIAFARTRKIDAAVSKYLGDTL